MLHALKRLLCRLTLHAYDEHPGAFGPIFICRWCKYVYPDWGVHEQTPRERW